MGVRQALNEHPRASAGVAVGVIAIALAFVFWTRLRPEGPPEAPSKAFFTTDDSSPTAAKAALFSDAADKLPPFQKDGKNAYRAYVFSCDGGKTTWIGYLEKFTTQGLERMKAGGRPGGAREGGAGASPSNAMVSMEGVQVKKPGDAQWTDMSNLGKASLVTDLKCPDGSRTNIVMVNP
jgi:hypothetical protein